MRAVLIPIAGLALMAAKPALATECVNPGGTGGCFPTVQQGVDAASPGELVKVEPGTYFETVVIGTPGVRLRGDAALAEDIVIDPDDPNTGPGITVTAVDVEIDRLTVRNGDGDGIKVMPSATGVLIKRVHVRGADADCIDIQADGAKVDRARLFGCGSDGVQAGLFAPPASTVIAGIEIVDTRVRGAASDGFDLTADDAVLTSNDVSLTAADCIRLFGDDARLDGNSLGQCGGSGIDMLPEEDDGVDPIVSGVPAENGGDDARIENTTLVSAQDDCIAVAGTGARVLGGKLDLCREDGVVVYGNEAHVKDLTLTVAQSDCVQVVGDGAQVDRNHIEHCHGEGVDVDGDGAKVRENAIARLGGDGIDVVGDTAVIADNHVAEMENTAGLTDGEAPSPRGIVARGQDHQVTGNTVEYGAEGPGILVNGPNPTVVGNTARALRLANSDIEPPKACSGGSDDGRLCSTGADCAGGGACIDFSAAPNQGRDGSARGGAIIVACGGFADLVFTDRGLGCGGGRVANNRTEGGVEANGFWIVHSNRGGTPDLIVEDNVAHGSSDDGFEVYGSGITLRRNQAIENGDSSAGIGDNGFLVYGIQITSEDNLAVGGVEDGFQFCGQVTSTGDQAVANGEDGLDVGGDRRDSPRYAPFSGSNTELLGDAAIDGFCPEPFDVTTVAATAPNADENLAVGVEISETSTGSSVVGSTTTDNREGLCDEGVGTTGDVPTGPCVVD